MQREQCNGIINEEHKQEEVDGGRVDWTTPVRMHGDDRDTSVFHETAAKKIKNNSITTTQSHCGHGYNKTKDKQSALQRPKKKERKKRGKYLVPVMK